ncbi:MAG: DNA-3-methyladenine glycosylase 2 family protein [Saprospiraceae bacterium]
MPIWKKQLIQDPILAPLIESIKLEPTEVSDDVYFRLIRAIVYQQLSGKAAATIFGRFEQLFSDGYPHPEMLLDLPISSLRAAGLSNQKATYVQHVARYFIEEDLMRQDWSCLPDDVIQNRLTAIKGVGKWTAQMILIFTLGRKDIFPLGDLAIRQSMQELYQVNSKGKQLEKDLCRIAAAWRPYRSVASRYLWAWRDARLP